MATGGVIIAVAVVIEVREGERLRSPRHWMPTGAKALASMDLACGNAVVAFRSCLFDRLSAFAAQLSTLLPMYG